MNDMTRPDANDIDPPLDYPPYQSTRLRHPKQPLVAIPATLLDVPGPTVPRGFVKSGENDLTAQGRGLPLGERMVLTGRLVDADGRPIRRSLIEIWQTNASGRYMHPGDQHDAPLDANFPGIGRTFTDDEGRYRFLTIRPGSYPWQNHPFAWRPAHIHFSLLGNAPVQRLITQMYFPGDPMLALDPVFHGVPDEAARERMVCKLALETGIEGVATGYTFDIALGGAKSTPLGI